MAESCANLPGQLPLWEEHRSRLSLDMVLGLLSAKWSHWLRSSSFSCPWLTPLQHPNAEASTSPRFHAWLGWRAALLCIRSCSSFSRRHIVLGRPLLAALSSPNSRMASSKLTHDVLSSAIAPYSKKIIDTLQFTIRDKIKNKLEFYNKAISDNQIQNGIKALMHSKVLLEGQKIDMLKNSIMYTAINHRRNKTISTSKI